MNEKEKKQGLTGAQIGTAMHTVLEECDLRKKYDRESLEELIAALVTRGRLTEEEGKAIRRGRSCNSSAADWRKDCVRQSILKQSVLSLC